MENMKYLSKEEIMKLPKEVQEDIYQTLKSYNEVNIVYEYGKYHVNTFVALTNGYAPDHKVIGDVRKEDIYTKEEMIINYAEAFHDYSIDYKGKRDYKMFDEVKGNWNAKFEFDRNGNLVRVA